MDLWVRKIFWRRDRLPTPVFLGFPGGSVVKSLPANLGAHREHRFDLGQADPLEGK